MFVSHAQTVQGYPPLAGEYAVNAVTPSDSTDLVTGPLSRPAIGLISTSGGQVTVNLVNGGTAVLQLTANTRNIIAVSRVLATGTTATGISALY